MVTFLLQPGSAVRRRIDRGNPKSLLPEKAIKKREFWIDIEQNAVMVVVFANGRNKPQLCPRFETWPQANITSGLGNIQRSVLTESRAVFASIPSTCVNLLLT